MACFDKKSGFNQTYWGPPSPSGERGRWYADIDSKVTDQEVIEQAKLVVDTCIPPKWTTQHGLHYYSFIKRAFLLNQLLFSWEKNGMFPEGWVCLTDVEVKRPSEETGWLSFAKCKTQREYSPPQWIQIPSVAEALQKQKDEQAQARAKKEAIERVAVIPRREYGDRW